MVFVIVFILMAVPCFGHQDCNQSLGLADPDKVHSSQIEIMMNKPNKENIRLRDDTDLFFETMHISDSFIQVNYLTTFTVTAIAYRGLCKSNNVFFVVCYGNIPIPEDFACYKEDKIDKIFNVETNNEIVIYYFKEDLVGQYFELRLVSNYSSRQSYSIQFDFLGCNQTVSTTSMTTESTLSTTEVIPCYENLNYTSEIEIEDDEVKTIIINVTNIENYRINYVILTFPSPPIHNYERYYFVKYGLKTKRYLKSSKESKVVENSIKFKINKTDVTVLKVLISLEKINENADKVSIEIRGCRGPASSTSPTMSTTVFPTSSSLTPSSTVSTLSPGNVTKLLFCEESKREIQCKGNRTFRCVDICETKCPDERNEQCEFGMQMRMICACPDGYVEKNDKCIKKSECDACSPKPTLNIPSRYFNIDNCTNLDPIVNIYECNGKCGNDFPHYTIEGDGYIYKKKCHYCKPTKFVTDNIELTCIKGLKNYPIKKPIDCKCVECNEKIK